MALRRFIKLPKHQQYQYKPRFWDPEKEELKDRLRRIEDQKTGGSEGMKARISSGMKKGYLADARERKKLALRSNMVLFAVIIFLLGLCYVFLMVYLPQIVDGIDDMGS